MKYLIASDIHGSAKYMQAIIERLDTEKADKLILLGDIYNHGPRNPLPEEYQPLKVADILNANLDRLIVIKGNCDSQVDTLISQFDFIPHLLLEINGKSFLLTHGHEYNEQIMPKAKIDGIIYGHFHTGFIKQNNGVIISNAGSASLPKNGTKNSYLILDDKSLTLKDIHGEVLENFDF